MEGQKNNKGVIALLVVIILILSILCVLFVTNTITFNKDNGVNESNSNVIDSFELSNMISEWEIKEKFAFVYDYYAFPVVYCGETQIGMIKIGEKDYYMSYEFKTYVEMLNSLKQYMLVDVMFNKYAFKATDKNNYLEKDNNLYCEVTNKGYVYSHSVKEIDIIKEEFNKISFIGNMELTDPDGNKTFDKVNCTIEYINDNWIITSYKKNI